MDNQKLKITFAPGAFDDFEGTQEELDQLVAEIKQMFESGDAFEKATPIDLDPASRISDRKTCASAAPTDAEAAAEGADWS